MVGFRRRKTIKSGNKNKGDDPSKFSEGTDSIDESVDSNVPIKVIHTTINNDTENENHRNNMLSPAELKKLEKESKNKFNLGKLYLDPDPTKSREAFLTALFAREKAHETFDEDEESPARKASIQELAEINDKLGQVEQKLDNIAEAISRYTIGLKYYKSIPDPPANQKKAFGSETLERVKGKGAKAETKAESIKRVKGLLSELDPLFVDTDIKAPPAAAPQDRVYALTKVVRILKDDKKKSEDDEMRHADIYEAFSVASASTTGTPFSEDDEPVEFPKINDEDYNMAEIKYSEPDYSEAKDYYTASYEKYTHKKSESNTSAHEKSIISCMLLERIAMCYALLKDYPNSSKFYEDGLKILNKESPKEKNDDDNNDSKVRSIILFRIYLRLANVHLDFERPEHAVDCYVKAFPILIETRRITMNEELTSILLNCIHAHDNLAKKSKKCSKTNGALLNYKVMLDLMKIYMNQGKMYKRLMNHDYLRATKTIGAIYIEMGKYQLAFEFFHTTMKQYSFSSNDEEKRDTKIIAIIYHNMAILGERRGRYRAALGFYAKSLERKRKVFVKPKDIKDKVGKTVLYMAFVHYQIGEEDTALQFFEEAIEVFDMNVAKSNYDEYASVYIAVSTIYAKRDDIDNAIYYTKQKINLAERCDDGKEFSSIKKDVADSYHNMGLFNSYKKLYEQSIDCYRESFEIKKVALTQKQSQADSKMSRRGIFLTLRNLAAALNATGEFEDAVQTYKDCLLYTNDVIDRVSTFNKIGVLLCKLNKSISAMEYYSKALQEESALQASSTLNDPHARKIDMANKQNLYMALLNNAGNCVSDTTDDIDTALGYFQKASDLRSSDQSAQSSSSISTLEGGASMGIIYNMGMMYMKNQDFVNAVDCFIEYLNAKGYNKSSPTKNTNDEKEKKSIEEIASVLNNIGNVKYNQGLYEESIDFFSKSLSMKESIYGSRSSKLALTVSNLGTSYYHLKDYDSALKKIEFAVTLLQSCDDNYNHDQSLETDNRIATLHNKIGNIHAKSKEYTLATSEYQKAYRMKKELLQDEQHPELLLVKHNIALIHVKTGNLEEALSELQSILERKVSVLGQDHLAVVKLMLDISGVLFLTKQFREARKLCELSLSKFRNANIPDNHSYMLQAEHTLKKITEAQQWKVNIF